MLNQHYSDYVFLTGGSSGIGRAIAELLAQNGYIVFSASRNPPSDTKFYPSGGEIRPVTIDVRNAESVEKAAEFVSKGADIGIIIHCAGIGIACPGESFPVNAVNDLMDTNFTGVLRVNHSFLPRLRERGGGLCIIIGSVGGIFPIPFQSHYCASKAALDIYSAALRMELSDFNVQVSLVLPGDTNTGFTNARSYEIDKSSPYYEKCISAVRKMEKDELKGHPPESVAKVVLKICRRKKAPQRVTIGFGYKLLVFFRRLLPNAIIEKLLKSMYIK